MEMNEIKKLNTWIMNDTNKQQIFFPLSELTTLTRFAMQATVYAYFNLFMC